MRAKPVMNAPRNRRSCQSWTTRNTPTMIAVAVSENSYMFAHGTRDAAIPRSTAPTTWSTHARMVSAIAARR
jgi:hypothetical protein